MAIFVAAYIIPGVAVSGVFAALVAAAVLGVVNVLIKPIIFILTLPINILTLGSFTFVIEAVLILLTSHFVSGFNVTGFVPALWFALGLTIINWIFHFISRR
jgi:putative membrane protein